MKIVIYWNNEESKNLIDITNESLNSIWLNDFIEVTNENSEEYKKTLSITKDYAFCIEEDSIDFKDIIFEWTTPSREEIDALLISIIGWSNNEWCSSWWCGSCSSWWCCGFGNC